MPNNSRDQLLYAFRRVLRPLMRILVRSGVRYDEFLELIRGVYVETAVRDGLGDGVKPSRAKISISTGVPRRDVDRFIDNDGALPLPPKTLTDTLSEILNKWHTDPLFVGPYGIPLELEVKSQKSRSFSELVNAVDTHVSASDVLEELVRLRTVVWSGDTHVRTVSRAFIPVEEMSPAQLEFFGNALTRLANTLQFNMDRQNSSKRLERSVISDRGLPASVVPIFEKHVRERVSELLIDLDNWLSPYSAQVQPGFEFEKVGLAVFQFVDPVADLTPLREKVASDARDLR
ncbi:MAG TPA: DUF6502 family protein [Steroidobacteraceae bacterium]|nr:DUF6502 family protein [Steroidobacteraceae bacterium]